MPAPAALPPAGTGDTHLILIRHGQSLYNRDGAEAGEDSGLTDLGWQQAELVASWLCGQYNPAALVASSLLRARQTASVISDRLGMPLVVLPGLEETEHSYIAELAPLTTDALYAWDHSWQPGLAEAPIYTAFRNRVRVALATILQSQNGRTVFIVTHGGVMGTILRTLFGGHQVVVETENTGVTHIAWCAGRWRLVYHNSTEHLREMRTPSNR